MDRGRKATLEKETAEPSPITSLGRRPLLDELPFRVGGLSGPRRPSTVQGEAAGQYCFSMNAQRMMCVIAKEQSSSRPMCEDGIRIGRSTRSFSLPPSPGVRPMVRQPLELAYSAALRTLTLFPDPLRARRMSSFCAKFLSCSTLDQLLPSIGASFPACDELPFCVGQVSDAAEGL